MSSKVARRMSESDHPGCYSPFKSLKSFELDAIDREALNNRITELSGHCNSQRERRIHFDTTVELNEASVLPYPFTSSLKPRVSKGERKGRRTSVPKQNVYSSFRGEDILPLFLKSEGWAKDDWKRVLKNLTPEEVSALEPDYVIRTVRSSSFMAQPERRVKRNLQLCKSRTLWKLQYNVDDIFTVCGLTNSQEMFTETLGTEPSYRRQFKRFRSQQKDIKEHKSHFQYGLKARISPGRVEQFRDLVFPLKLFGFSKDKNPIVKFSLKEANWKEAVKLFKNKLELKYLLILSLESLFLKLKQSSCSALASSPPVNGSISEAETVCNNVVCGKYILICDVDGINFSEIKYGYLLQVHKIVELISKYYPETVLKTYVISSKYFQKGSRILSPFVPKRIIKRMKFFHNEKTLIKNLLENDEVQMSQIPVELGGNFEGRYVLEISSD